MALTLRPPASPDDWQAFHDIREDVLFIARGRPRGYYDRNHPDDFDPGNTPLLLKRDGRPIGTVRLDDFHNGTGATRLVAIVPSLQGQGHGTAMMELVDAIARGRGMHTLYVNAAQTAVRFYEKCGWEHHVWDPAELASLAADCIQMRKRLG